MTTSLGMAILGLLSREPLTGYALTRTMKGPIYAFWQARHSQVYPELARLEGEGLVSCERVPQQGKPDQKRFALTQAGLEALRNWLTGPLSPAPLRSEICLRAYCMAKADPAKAAAFFRGEAERHRERLEQFEAYRAALEALPGGISRDHRDETFVDYSVVMRGIAMEKAQVEWCTWMADRHGSANILR